ncbi:MAG: carboxypeptidase-like regulatory domain-containing protein, partial [Candidatus Sulfotelmatobacter sp.]
MITQAVRKNPACARRTCFQNVVPFALLLLLLGTSLLVEAQVETGKIVGSVKDSSGAFVTGATVTVTETQTDVQRQAITNGQGEYVVTELKAGEYTVTVEHAGFKKAVQTAFKLDVNQVVRVDFALDVGSITEKMVVTAAEPLVESETSSLGQVIEQSRVNDLPLDGR